MERKNGNGIFLGVVSAATLVVAIVGATFAYFTASVASNEDAVDLKAYEFKTSVLVEQVAPAKTSKGLIPMDAETKMAAALTKKCQADDDYVGCVIYKATLTNESENEAKVSVQLKTTSITNFQNLEAKEITYDTANGTYADGSLAAVALPTSIGEATTTGMSEITIPGKTDSGNGTASHYFVVYLKEAADANNAEMAGTYSGQLVYTSTTGAAGKLTASFTLPEQQ